MFHPKAMVAPGRSSEDSAVELTILMPCLNEAGTLPVCIHKARAFLAQAGIRGEVLVADNGSSDASREIAASAGARVVAVLERGYGAALLGGIRSARGKYVVMADADDSYDFSALQPFVEALRQGFQLVMGNRFQGGIRPGAMPALHRYLGNPVLSFIGRLFFRTKIGDFHCGLRAFERSAILSLNLTTTGMEFASELVVKSVLAKLLITEVPVVLYPDGRNRPPHLRSWRDGWRHLRFMLLYSPRWLFLYPGMLLLVMGMLGSATLLPGIVRIGQLGFDIHSLLYFSAMSVVGLQMVLFGVLARVTAAQLGLLPQSRITLKLLRGFRLEVGIGFALMMLLAAGLIAARNLMGWEGVHFGALDSSAGMRLTIPAATLGIAGMEVLVASFWMTFLQYVPHAPLPVSGEDSK